MIADRHQNGLNAARLLQTGVVVCVLVMIPTERFGYERYALPKELALHGTAMAAAAVLVGQLRKLTITSVDILLLSFLGWSLLSAIVNATNDWLAFRAVAISASSITVFYVGRAILIPDCHIRLARAVGVAAVAAAATAILEAYGLVDGASMPGRAPGGTMGNRNFMAHLVVLGTPVLVFLAAEARTRRAHLVTLLAVALAALSVTLSRSRAAWLASMTAAIVALFSIVRSGMLRSAGARRRSQAILGALIAGVTAGVLLPNALVWSSARPYLTTLANLTAYDVGTGRGRLIQYRNAIEMIRDHPVLGVGPGNWSVLYPLYTAAGDPSYNPSLLEPVARLPSSDWLGFAVERGIPALAILWVAIFALARARGGVSDRSAKEVAQLVTLRCSIAALLVLGALDSVLLTPAASYLVHMSWAALAAPRRALTALELSTWTRRIAIGATVSIGAVLLIRTSTQVAVRLVSVSEADSARYSRLLAIVPGEYQLQLLAARRAARDGDCVRARRYATAAQRLQPYVSAPTRVIAFCERRARELTNRRVRAPAETLRSPPPTRSSVQNPQP